MRFILTLSLVLLVYLNNVSCFYVPGVAPVEFQIGQEVEIKVCGLPRKKYFLSFYELFTF